MFSSSLLNVGTPEAALILLVGYFVLGPQDLYRVAKEAGRSFYPPTPNHPITHIQQRLRIHSTFTVQHLIPTASLSSISSTTPPPPHQ